jgi:hypothetical protein
MPQTPSFSSANTHSHTQIMMIFKWLFHPVQVKADIEKRIQEKEEEFEGTRRNHAKVRVPLFANMFVVPLTSACSTCQREKV